VYCLQEWTRSGVLSTRVVKVVNMVCITKGCYQKLLRKDGIGRVEVDLSVGSFVLFNRTTAQSHLLNDHTQGKQRPI